MLSYLNVAVALYLVGLAAYIVSENRSPKATFAWMFLFVVLPVAGLVLYVLFGRETKAFSRQRKLVRQDLPGHLADTLSHFERQHEEACAAMAGATFPRARLVDLVRSNAHAQVTSQNCAEVLQDAEETYPRLMADLRAARQSIHLQYYSWASDAVGQELKAILLDRVAHGVEVRLLYDPVGSFWMLSWSYIREMRAGGVRMLPFSRLWRLHTISFRNHRKIAVIDGRIGYTGGLNIGSEHLNSGGASGGWRDTHLRLTGAAVRALQAVFVVDWSNATGEEPLPPSCFPEPDESARRDYLPVQMCLSGPDSEWSAIRQLYFTMIAAARRRVVLTSPFFLLDDAVSAAIQAAALSGVEVKIMISATGPSRVPYWAANTFAEEVAKAGAEVFLYEAGYLHAKTICVDGDVCAVGSANWDIRSFLINYELNAVIYDRGITAELEQAFARDLPRCRRFDLEAYQTSSRLLRFRDSVARLASPLM